MQFKRQTLFLILCFLSACQEPQTVRELNPVPLADESLALKKIKYNSAKDGVARAQIRANIWDSSAQLVRVEGRWIDENGRSFDWVYYFTAEKKAKALMVDGDTSIELERVFKEPISPVWTIDSDQAMGIANQNGWVLFPVYAISLNYKMQWEVLSDYGPLLIDAQTGKISS